MSVAELDQVSGEAADSLAASLRQRLFGIDPSEASFARRGFASAHPARQQRLEQIGRTFATGYNAAIRGADPTSIAANLAAFPTELAGFAYEGAGMGFAILDLLAPWRSKRFAAFLTGAAASHIYMVYVGAGWALARTSPHLAWRLGSLDPLLRWLMFDGYGFHAGYFHPAAAVVRQHVPSSLRGHARKVFDQGLGRSLWFICGAQVPSVVTAVGKFPAARQSDLWSGVGLAATYAGGVEHAELAALAEAAGAYRTRLAQGAAFAAKARVRAGNPAPHTELACQVFCHMSAADVALVTDAALPTVHRGDDGQAYQAWRDEISRRIGKHVGLERHDAVPAR